MSFLKKIKADLRNEEKMRGMRGKVTVDTKSLMELVAHFESLDSYHRSTSYDFKREVAARQLGELITTVYRLESKNSEKTLMIIMDTLRPLMEERHKEEDFKTYFT